MTHWGTNGNPADQPAEARSAEGGVARPKGRLQGSGEPRAKSAVVGSPCRAPGFLDLPHIRWAVCQAAFCPEGSATIVASSSTGATRHTSGSVHEPRPDRAGMWRQAIGILQGLGDHGLGDRPLPAVSELHRRPVIRPFEHLEPCPLLSMAEHPRRDAGAFLESAGLSDRERPLQLERRRGRVAAVRGPAAPVPPGDTAGNSAAEGGGPVGGWRRRAVAAA